MAVSTSTESQPLPPSFPEMLPHSSEFCPLTCDPQDSAPRWDSRRSEFREREGPRVAFPGVASFTPACVHGGQLCRRLSAAVTGAPVRTSPVPFSPDLSTCSGMGRSQERHWNGSRRCTCLLEAARWLLPWAWMRLFRVEQDGGGRLVAPKQRLFCFPCSGLLAGSHFTLLPGTPLLAPFLSSFSP